MSARVLTSIGALMLSAAVRGEYRVHQTSNHREKFNELIFDGWLVTCSKTWQGMPPTSPEGKAFPVSSGLDVFTSSARLPLPFPTGPGNGPTDIEYMIQVTSEEAVVANEKGQFWKIRRAPGAMRTAVILPWNANQPNWDSQVSGRADVIKPASVTASDESPDSPAMALWDGKLRTRWGVTADAGKPAWVEFQFAAPERIAEMVLLNGWIPEDGKFMAYGSQHRAKALRIAFDGGEGQVYQLHDVNCPQAIRFADAPTARRVRLTVEESCPAEVSVPNDPPRLSLSEVAFRRAKERAEAQ